MSRRGLGDHVGRRRVRLHLYVAHRRDQKTTSSSPSAIRRTVVASRGVTEAASYYEIDTHRWRTREGLVTRQGTEIVCVRGFDAYVDSIIESNDDDQRLARSSVSSVS